MNWLFIAKYDSEERAVNMHAAVVLDVAEFPKLVHQKVHTATRGTIHFR
jgi:hypothetical protein